MAGRVTTQDKNKALQTWLNQLVSPSPGLTVNGKMDKPTIEAIKKFQTAEGIVPASGKMTIGTWKAIGRKIGPGYRTKESLKGLPFFEPQIPLVMMRMLQGLPVGALRFDRSIFLAEYMEDFKGQSDSQIKGLDRLLSFIEADHEVNDISWAAYMIITAKYETNHTYQPIAENGCKESRWPGSDVCSSYTRKGKTYERKYGNPVTCPASKLTTAKTCPAGKPHHCYYGRGYVQLTHGDNYKKLGDEIGMGETLVHYPERVMEPDVAYKIMSAGMRKGLFRRDSKGAHTLKRHLSEAKSDQKDYYQARNIINGIHHATAEEMAKDAVKVEAILLAARVI